MPASLERRLLPRGYPRGIDWVLSTEEKVVLAYFFDQLLAGEGKQYKADFYECWLVVPSAFLTNEAMRRALEDLLAFGLLDDPLDINWGYEEDGTDCRSQAWSVLQNHVSLSTLGQCVCQRLRTARFLPISFLHQLQHEQRRIGGAA